MCADGWAGVGWPKEWGGRGMTPIEQFVFFDESMRVGRAGADAHDQLGRADDHALRLRGAEAVLRRQDPEGRDPLRDRLHRARRRHRPRVAEDARPCATATSTSSTARRSSRASRAAPTTSGSRCARAPRRRSTRASRSSSCPPTRPASRTSRSRTSATRTRTSRTTRTCACPAGNLVGEENQGWSLITNQLNHERVTLCSSGIVERQLDDVRKLGAGDEARRRPARDRPGMGAGQPGPRARQARVPEARELEDRVARAAGRGAEPGRRVGDQGVRHRVLHGGGAPPDGGHARPGAVCRATRRARWCAAGSSAWCAACTSSRSAAAPTRCNAT